MQISAPCRFSRLARTLLWVGDTEIYELALTIAVVAGDKRCFDWAVLSEQTSLRDKVNVRKGMCMIHLSVEAAHWCAQSVCRISFEIRSSFFQTDYVTAFCVQNGQEMPTLKDINEAITQEVTYSRVKLQRWKAQAVQKPNWSRLMEYF